MVTDNNIPQGEKVDHIVSLGFITNECPIRDIKDFINDLPIHSRIEKLERWIEHSAPSYNIAIGILIVMGLFILCTCAYFCAKNRARYCPREKKGGENIDI